MKWPNLNAHTGQRQVCRGLRLSFQEFIHRKSGHLLFRTPKACRSAIASTLDWIRGKICRCSQGSGFDFRLTESTWTGPIDIQRAQTDFWRNNCSREVACPWIPCRSVLHRWAKAEWYCRIPIILHEFFFHLRSNWYSLCPVFPYTMFLAPVDACRGS